MPLEFGWQQHGGSLGGQSDGEKPVDWTGKCHPAQAPLLGPWGPVRVCTRMGSFFKAFGFSERLWSVLYFNASNYHN